MVIIGITGKNASGKDTVAEYLVSKGFKHFSLSDIIREEARKRKLKLTRENLIKLGNELRAKYGAGILAEKVLEKIDKTHNYVVTSIRNPVEVFTLQKRPDFILISIEAPDKVRYERAVQRDKEKISFEEFLKKERIEFSDDPVKQQLDKVLKMAKIKIINDGSFEQLYVKVDKFLRDWTGKLFLKRPSWDIYFMNIAKQVALRGNCIKRKVGAVIVKDKRILSSGYNGTPRGVKNCYEGGCPRCNSWAASGTKLGECICNHAEENAITQAAYHGVNINGSSIYVTISPCLTCAKMIIQAGIKEVVYSGDYPMTDLTIKLFKEAGVKIRKINV